MSGIIMGTNLKDLCRLCARKNEFSKDLLDEQNKSVLDLIRQFTQIAVNECENMPTKVCLDCEEKMVSFQLFILEVYRVQDTLRKMFLEESSEMDIKLEDAVQFESPLIKSEVKDELTNDDLACTLGSEINLTDVDEDDYQDVDFGYDDNDDDETDNEPIANLKDTKNRIKRRKLMTNEEIVDFNNVLKKPNLKVKDFVRLHCTKCDAAEFKSWPNLRFHYFKTHKSKPVVNCICGFAIKSKTVLYKHVTDHKMESKRMQKRDLDLRSDGDSKESILESRMNSLSVTDFIKFICAICDKRCLSWYSLKSHCDRSHKVAPVVTCSCGVTLKSKSVMYKHVQDHKNPNELSCDQCSLVTKSVAALEKHKMKHVPKSERKFPCPKCDKVYPNKDALKSHERSHIPIDERKIYQCEECDMKFTTRSSAASHKRVVHEKIKSYVCDLCGYACGTNGELRQHRAIHSDDKPFVCKKCSKPFKTYSNLKTHMDTHEDTSYACYVCSRVLNSRRTLRKHLLVHEDKCRHVCSYCNKAFKRRQTLKVHMYTHTGDKPLSCKWCDERFAYASTLRSHRLRCHPDKMAAQAHSSYNNYSHAVIQNKNYIDEDLSAIGVTKNEVDAV